MYAKLFDKALAPELRTKRVFILVRALDMPAHIAALPVLSNGAIAVDISRYQRREGEEGHCFIGGKWSGIYDYFQQHPDVLDRFEYIWLPDDDIESTVENALEFLSVVARNGFRLAQPALELDSYFAHALTLQSPYFIYRNTSLVELMMPVFSSALLKEILPLFKDRHAALGLDLFWHQLPERSRRAVAIVDATPMGHYRPRQQFLAGKMTEMQISILEESRATHRQLGIRRQPLANIGGKTRSGIYLKQGPLLTWLYMRGLKSNLHRMTRRSLSTKELKKLKREQRLFDFHTPAFDQGLYQRFLADFKDAHSKT
ncbi:DUF707 domain-containing protein [Sinorhizobium alkalisoli]|uniref:DUF707 domain-containing protein n=1 Tax=Sinorhizobium alkalisoli TaxID=1752398 RepID=A0A1E3V406_9HYPH|nr:DUF707 domain-containing protein [Sinorhizobium alkalisoli]ODR88358.1 hypothetical protein A8M32_25450 [Sinorhizobium alkalisoli]